MSEHTEEQLDAMMERLRAMVGPPPERLYAELHTADGASQLIEICGPRFPPILMVPLVCRVKPFFTPGEPYSLPHPTAREYRFDGRITEALAIYREEVR